MNAVYNTMAVVNCFRSVQDLERVHCGRTSANSATYALTITGRNSSLSSRTPLLIDSPFLLRTNGLAQCFSTFVRPRPGKFFFYKTRARSQQIIGLHAVFMTGPFPEC
jgi:hypothetical protein